MRHLAAILVADIVGFASLMESDEDGTISRLQALRRTLLEPKITQYRGRLVKEMGDGLLLEFPSVVGAVRFAVEIQTAMERRSPRAAENTRLIFRMGIHLGDVVDQGDDILGDGVNIAARLESHALPGGISISAAAKEQLTGKLNLTLENSGKVTFKNISRPIAVYRVIIDEMAQSLATPVIIQDSRATPDQHKGFHRFAALSVLMAVSAVVLFLWQPWLRSAYQKQSETSMVSAKPSIAVLPFEDLSDGLSQAYFANGITEDLITDLSKVSGVFVISGHSTFLYKDKKPTTSEIAEKLGVRYILQGSVRRGGDVLRVNSQLIDASSGAHIWAERFDGDVEDIFAVQDSFVLQIVAALESELTEPEKQEIGRVVTRSVAAREAFQQGWELYSRLNERDSLKAIPFLEKAVSIDPEYGQAYGALALVYQRNGVFRWNHDPSVPRNMVYHTKVQKYLNLAGQYPTAMIHIVRAMRQLNFRGQVTGETGKQRVNAARIEAGAAIALQPSEPEAHLVMAWALIAGGQPQDALNAISTAKLLNPNHPAHYFLFEAAAFVGTGDLEKASGVLEEGLERHPDAIELIPFTASVYAQVGRRMDANALVQAWVPGQYQEPRERAAKHYFMPMQWAAEFEEFNQQMMGGLRLAALPMEVTVVSLLSDLRRQDPSEQVVTIRNLSWFGHLAETAVPDLIEMLKSDSVRVRREAAITLGRIGSAANEALPALQEISKQAIVGKHARKSIQEISED